LQRERSKSATLKGLVFSSQGGWIKVSGSTWLSKRQTVYNLEVEDYHTYFVGESGAWVHNMCAMKAPRFSSKRAVIKRKKLPTQVRGKIRYIPPKNWHPSEPLPRGPRGGFMDKFGNEWTKGASRTKGQPFEWDVQRPDGKHWNISLDGKVTH
jgi:hypothetical protein